MNPLASKELVKKLKMTLQKNGINYNRLIANFGQVSVAEKRAKGMEFSLKDHVKGVVLALLSNQRSWGQIAKNREKIDEIFYHYDPDKLEIMNPEELLKKVREIRCGNRSIRKQLRSLSSNIKKFREIASEFGSIDRFIIHKPAEEIAEMLSKQESKYKIQGLGFTLAMEYLRNVGIRGMKPDLHLLRICGAERLGIFPPSVSPKNAAIIFNEFSKKVGVNKVYLDNLFWIFGAKDYANICSAKTKCYACELRNHCKYPKNHRITDQKH
jgi:thermostable 8-oxoguanine DNA glycosylase